MSMSDSKNILKMTEEQTLQFVTLYGQETVLWHTEHSSYKLKSVRKRAAERIATAMNIKGFGTEEVVKKFKNLRSSYCQELKKIETYKNSGKIYVPRVIWFAKMHSFIRPFVSSHWHKDTQSNCVSNSEVFDRQQHTYFSPEDSAEERNIIKMESFDDDNSLTTTELILNDDIGTAETSVPADLLKIDDDQEIEQTRKRIKIQSCDDSNSSFTRATLSDDMTERAESPGTTALYAFRSGDMGDCFDQFGKYIASVLRKLPLKNACSLQQEMTQLAMNAVMESGVSR